MSAYRPGDSILRRYIPHATEAEREEARENLYRFARLLVRIHKRLAADNPQVGIRAEAEVALDSESLAPSV